MLSNLDGTSRDDSETYRSSAPFRFNITVRMTSLFQNTSHCGFLASAASRFASPTVLVASVS